MYEHDREKYFVMDGHIHFWDASPENWVKGPERYAEGWSECFHAYHALAPPETHWPMEKFRKYSEEDFVKDVLERVLRRHYPTGMPKVEVATRVARHMNPEANRSRSSRSSAMGWRGLVPR